MVFFLLFFFIGNTVSNLIMILPPIYGALRTFKNRLEVRYVLSFLGLAGKHEQMTKAVLSDYYKHFHHRAVEFWCACSNMLSFP